MRWLGAHSPFLVSAVLLMLLLTGAYPFYQYYIDPDATAYLTIAQRYAHGDLHRAINGYWSPWSIWLTAALMKTGIAAFRAAILVNTIGALGFLAVAHSFFRLFRLQKIIQWLLESVLAIFLVYAVFWQSFADLWGFFFLLIALRLLLMKNFSRRPTSWILTGFAGALAYLAKAYAFPYFILLIVVCGFFVCEARLKVNRARWLGMAAVCTGTMLFFSAPWIYFLHEKYGIWTTGTAGTLNTSWYLVGHPLWKENIQALLPPVYPDSPSYWEDPYVANGATPHFWHSPKLLLLQLVRLGFNLLKFVQSANELSCFFILAVVIAVVLLLSKKLRARVEDRFFILGLAFLLFPLGYLLINFQGRYLWFMLPLSMILLGVALQRTSLFHQLRMSVQRFLLVLLAGSYAVQPVLGLKEMYRKGESEYALAQTLKQAGIRGSFITNVPYGPETQNIVRLSYFSGCSYYNMPLPAAKKALLEDARRYGVHYYFHFFDGEWSDFQLTNPSGQPFPELMPGKFKGLKVFLLND